GITSTPVIDPPSGTDPKGTLYVVALTKESVGNTTTFVQRLHALDLTTGAEKLGGPVDIKKSVDGTGAGTKVPFDAQWENQRAALLLVNGVVYVGFASHDDLGTYHGWLLGFDATTLQLVMAFDTTPNGSDGGIWQGGGGPAADSDGNIYFVTGNGTFDANSGGSDYGDSIVKISPSGAVLDYLTPHEQDYLNTADLDLGSGGPLLLPPDQSDPSPHLLVTAGKEGTVYLVNRDNMGRYNLTDQIPQSLSNVLLTGVAPGSNFKPPVYFGGFVYFGANSDTIRAFPLSNGLLSTPPSQSPESYNYPGAAMAISANGNTNGILWAVERPDVTVPGVLHAYDATNVGTELYNSSQSGSRDTLDSATKFAPPTVVNGKVFVASVSQLAVYGLLSGTVGNSHSTGFDAQVSQDGSDTLQTGVFSTTTNSDLLVAFVAYDGPTTAPQTATVSGAGVPWQLVTRSNAQFGTAEIWVAKATNMLTSVTVTSQPGVPGGYHGSLTVIAFANASGAGMVGQASAPSGAPDISLPGVSAGSWVFAVGNDWDQAIARTPVSGQVLVQQNIDTAVGDTFWVQRTAAPSTANALVDIHDSAPTTDRWNYAAIEIVATPQ
ncbi:MAG TPA: hypothetical protein VKM54_21570, partial [Myxococcota bacterium]|nr:hypothetical protein [Myxococcota bacterium]